MKYRVETIGAVFSPRAIEEFQKLLETRAEEGYKLDSVFPVTQPGCLGLGQGSTTYLAIFEKQ